MSVETTLRVWDQSRAAGKGLLLALADQADPFGVAFVNRQLLAARCRMSEAHVDQTLIERQSWQV